MHIFKKLKKRGRIYAPIVVKLLNTNKHKDLNFVFVNHREKDELYPITTIEIAEAQQNNQELKVYFKETEKKTKRMYVFNLLRT